MNRKSEIMKQNELWELFRKTGKIEYYLAYKRAEKK
jgi:hypothetical protein